MLSRAWTHWKMALIFVQPETAIRWHRAGFKLYWKWISRHPVRRGRRPTSMKLRELIFRMVAENPTWGAPRIHGELKMLGFDISERSKRPFNDPPLLRNRAHTAAMRYSNTRF